MDQAEELVNQLKAITTGPDWGRLRMDLVARLKSLGSKSIDPIISAMRKGELSYVDIGDVLDDLGEAGTSPLVEVYKSPEVTIRKLAIQALGMCLDTHSVAVPALVQALKDEDPVNRTTAAACLCLFRARAQSAVPALIRTLSDKENGVRQRAMIALGQIGADPAVVAPSLRVFLHDPDAELRSSAIYALGMIGLPASEALSIYVEGVRDSEPAVREEALEALGRLGPAAAKALDSIMSAVTDVDKDVRLAAVETLGELESEAGPAEKVLLGALADPEKSIQRSALEALWKATRRADLVVPALVQKIAEQGGLDEVLCDLIAIIGPEAAPTVPHLIEALKKEDADLRWAASSALSTIGKGARIAIPALIEALKDKSGLVAGVAAQALAKIGKEAQPALMTALDHPESQVREFAADGIGSIGEAAIAAVPKLQKLIREDSSEDVRKWAAVALVEIARAPEVVPVLTEALESADNNLQLRSAKGLGTLGKSAKSAIPALKAAAQDGSEEVSAAARQAIRRIRPFWWPF